MPARRGGAAARRGSSRRPPCRPSARPTTTTARAHALREGLPRRGARLPRPVRPPARRRRAARATRPRSSACSSWCADAGVARDPLRRRHERGRRRGAARSTARGAVSLDLSALDALLEVDARVARGAHPGRRHRAAPGGRSSAAHGLRCATSRSRSSSRRSAAGSPRARAATSRPLYTHIDDLVESVRALTPGRRLGVAAAARLGRRAVARPDAARLRGHAGRDHRGVGARAAAARAPAPRPPCASPTSSRAPTRCGRSPSPACIRPTAA